MERQACWYSVVRYSPDELAGEVVNVGLVVHTIEDEKKLHYYLLEETSPKLKAVCESKAAESVYKSYKDILEFYLKESSSTLSGVVGKIAISSPHSQTYLQELGQFFKGKKLTLSEPTFSLSSDVKGLFKSLFYSYVGQKYYPNSEKELNVKGVVRKIFEDKDFLNTKVKVDIGIYPVPDLPIKINVDFGFKNGVWNYVQATPDIKNSSKGTEWFAKTKLLIENVNEAKIYLMYRRSVSGEKNETLELIKYLNDHEERVFGMDLDDDERIESLCKKIETEAHLLEEVS